jgi:hypothetical protein
MTQPDGAGDGFLEIIAGAIPATTVPLVYYDGRNRHVLGEATLDGEMITCRFDAHEGSVGYSLLRDDVQMSFNIHHEEVIDLRSPLFRGRPLLREGVEEQKVIDALVKFKEEKERHDGPAH